MKPTTQSGQALIEACLAAMALATSFVFLLVMIWLGVTWSQWDQSLHEALVCRVSHISERRKIQTRNCEYELKTRLEKGVIHPRLETLRWQKNQDSIRVRAQLKIQLPFVAKKTLFKMEKQMSWPPN